MSEISKTWKVISGAGNRKANCPTCCRKQNCSVETSLNEHATDGVIDAFSDYCILRCLGCDTIFFGEFSQFSEDFDIQVDQETGEQIFFYPIKERLYPGVQRRSRPKWQNTFFSIAHSDLDLVLDEIRTIFNSGHYTFSAIGVRTGFELASIELEIDSNLTFNEKLEQLRTKGHISPRERETLSVLIDAGSAAIHRGWRPDAEQVEVLIDTLEQFIQRSIVLPEDLDKLAVRIPKKPSAPK